MGYRCEICEKEVDVTLFGYIKVCADCASRHLSSCGKCGFSSFRIIVLDKGPHYKKLECARCRYGFIKFLPKPGHKEKRDTSDWTPKYVCCGKGYDVVFCFMCAREVLPSKEIFTVDHIREIQDGGDDELYNLQVLCSACHSYKNWLRTYLNKHNLKQA
jgi:hypothetical protein